MSKPKVTKELAALAWQRAYAEGDESGVDMSLRVARQVALLLVGNMEGYELISCAALDKLRSMSVTNIKAQGVIDFVFSGELPNATFVEVEDGNGNSINVGEWLKREDGYSVLRLYAAPVQQVSVPDGFERYRLADKFCEQRLVTDDHVRAIVVDAFASGYGFGIAAAPVPSAVVMPDKNLVINKAVGMCNRIPGSTTWNAAEFAYDEFVARLNPAPANHSEQALNMVPNIQKMARFLSDKSADMLGNSRESAWVGHGDHFVEVVTEMLAASPAAKGVKS